MSTLRVDTLQTPDSSFSIDIEDLASASNTVVKADLANDTDPLKGAALVGYRGSDVFTKLSEVITPKDFGAVGDGVTDDTAPVLAWAASTISKRKHFSGAYKVSAEVVFNPGDYVTGDGSTSIIDSSGGIGGALSCVRVTGALVALPNLFSNVAFRDNTLVLSAPPAVTIGDVILLWNPTDSSWSTWRTDYRAGEWLRVASLSGVTVTTYGLTYDSYVAAAMQVYKLVGPSTTFKDFQIKQPATSNAGLVVDLIDGPVVENVIASGGIYAGIDIRRSVDLKVNCRARQASAPSGNNYGLAVGNSQGGSIEGVYYGTRHPISLGGSPGVGSVSCRNFTITSDYKALDGAINAADLHGNTEDIKFIGGTFNNGGIVAGKNHKWVGCNFVGKTNSGIALYMGEVVSGTFEFMGCKFETTVDPNPSGNGILSFQNFTASVTGACNFIFTGAVINCPAATTFPILFALNGTSSIINVAFKGGLTFTGAAAVNQVLRLRQFGATGSFGFVTMPEVSGLPATGCVYATEVGSPTVSKYELPSQVGATNIAVTTAASVFTQAVTFAHGYPASRVPAIVLGTSNPTVGGKRIVSGYQGATSAGFTGIVATTDVTNFTSNATAGVNWYAELNEL